MRTHNHSHSTLYAPGTWAARGIPRCAAAGPLVALLVSQR